MNTPTTRGKVMEQEVKYCVELTRTELDAVRACLTASANAAFRTKEGPWHKLAEKFTVHPLTPLRERALQVVSELCQEEAAYDYIMAGCPTPDCLSDLDLARMIHESTGGQDVSSVTNLEDELENHGARERDSQ